MRPIVRSTTWTRVAMVLVGLAVALLVGCQFATAALDQSAGTLCAIRTPLLARGALSRRGLAICGLPDLCSALHAICRGVVGASYRVR